MIRNLSRLTGAAMIAATLAWSAGVAAAQQGTVPITPIDLPIGRSLPITMGVGVTRVAIAAPTVADIILISERELVINSVANGETDAIVWLADSSRVHYRISVHSPSDRKQILIGVKFAEVSRDALRESGVSALWRDDHTQVGTGIMSGGSVIQDGQAQLPGGRYLSVLSDLGTERVLAFLDAEERKGNARLLAEPTIMAGNNESATFLAGGEIPIPIVQGIGAGQNAGGGIGIQYREFGVRLNFTGEIVSDSLVKLNVTPEVSSLDYGNAITISGFQIPAFRTRRVSSTVDVRRDQSLIISGLFTGDESQVRTGVPLLKDIPILGLLFSSTRFQRNESELLVVVTPVIIDPMRPRAIDLMQFKSDTTRPAMDALRKRIPPQ